MVGHVLWELIFSQFEEGVCVDDISAGIRWSISYLIVVLIHWKNIWGEFQGALASWHHMRTLEKAPWRVCGRGSVCWDYFLPARLPWSHWLCPSGWSCGKSWWTHRLSWWALQTQLLLCRSPLLHQGCRLLKSSSSPKGTGFEEHWNRQGVWLLLYHPGSQAPRHCRTPCQCPGRRGSPPPDGLSLQCACLWPPSWAWRSLASWGISWQEQWQTFI